MFVYSFWIVCNYTKQQNIIKLFFAVKPHAGSFPDVPPYNQSETYCSTKKNNNTDIPIDTLIGAGAGGAVIIVFLVVLVIYFIRLANCSHCESFNLVVFVITMTSS